MEDGELIVPYSFFLKLQVTDSTAGGESKINKCARQIPQEIEGFCKEEGYPKAVSAGEGWENYPGGGIKIPVSQIFTFIRPVA
jgi:hypothetical protein